jgi:hypothetical protein
VGILAIIERKNPYGFGPREISEKLLLLLVRR